MKWWRIILAATWELPQTLLGLILLLFTKGYGKKPDRMKFANVYWRTPRWGVSLGPIIILGKVFDDYFSKEKQIQVSKHEHGHTIQSLMFGPIYLLIIGLPSITFNIMTRWGLLKNKDYYTRYPENWADKLGKVVRWSK